MSLKDDKQQNIQMKLDFSSALTGETRGVAGEGTESSVATNGTESPARTNRFMEEVCERENLKEALRQVKANKGSAGVDGITVNQLTDYLKQHWPMIREQLLNGTYAAPSFRVNPLLLGIVRPSMSEEETSGTNASDSGSGRSMLLFGVERRIHN